MWHILSTYANEISFIICGFLGGIAHYMKKSMKGETHAKIWEWFGPANAELTIYTLIVFTFVMIGALASGIINSNMTIWAVFYTGFITGYAVDSGVNSNAMELTTDISTIKGQTGDLFDVNKPKV
jgi:hypothetical protein